MDFDRDAVKSAIRGKIIELGKVLGMGASGIADLDIIPATGYLDSTVILERVVRYETQYGLALMQEEINIDNLGSIDAMIEFLVERKS